MKRTWDELCDRLEKQAKEIERLKKEKEWLMYKVLRASQKHYGVPYKKRMALLEDDMQQALKEK